ncbi:WXG100 family type VII secretion target [Microbacterium sp. MYb62]|uniref:WXG100 family type VII secretion target n=1 Tax=Microbacterium sp. MYb62 TaxID=1848690 RepID=UPI0015E34F37|nr:WXG100 family type VII secretion target [Microbacterium sp. MYb62]
MRVAVDHDAVANAVARLALTVRGFEHELDTLDAAATQLKDTWTGDAQNAYERAHREWSAAIRDMKALLAEATRRLITANAISGETAAIATGVWT